MIYPESTRMVGEAYAVRKADWTRVERVGKRNADGLDSRPYDEEL